MEFTKENIKNLVKSLLIKMAETPEVSTTPETPEVEVEGIDISDCWPILLNDKTEIFIKGNKAYTKDGLPFADGTYETVSRVCEYKSTLTIKEGLQIESIDTNINRITMEEIKLENVIGQPLIDGEYIDKDGNVIVVKGGNVESITPKETPAPTEEEMKASEIKASEFTENAVKEITLKLEEMSKKIEESGIKQIPTEAESKPLTRKEQIISQLEFKRKNK